MQQQKKKGAVIKGLAFPIGYTVFMNVFQSGAIVLIAVFCLLRAIMAFAAAPELGPEAFESFFITDYANLVSELSWFLSVLTTVLALVILWLVFNRKGRNFAEYFRFKRTSAKAIITAVLLGLSLFFIVSGLMTLIEMLALSVLEWIIELLRQTEPELAQQLEELFYTLTNTSTGDQAMFTLAAVLGAPLIEELAFRAGPLTNLTNRMRAFPAILITSAIFGLAHGNPIQMVYTFGLGIAMGYLFVKTDSIYPSIICHLAFNGANLISMVMGALFDTSYWVGHPSYDQISANLTLLSNITFWVYLVLSILIGIPMLVVGIILLVSLRRPAPVQEAQAEQQVLTHAPIEQPTPELTEAPAQELTQEPGQELTEAPVEEQVDEPIEEPVTEQAEELAEVVPEELTEEPDQEPACAAAAEETV